jgi:hypothetical protein
LLGRLIKGDEMEKTFSERGKNYKSTKVLRGEAGVNKSLENV